jgi:hypothetical protein
VSAGSAAGRGFGVRHLPLILAVAMALPALLVMAALLGAASGHGAPSAVEGIPGAYLSLYRQAAAHYDLGADGWSVLAAIGKVECDHGRSKLLGCHRGETNSAGARGPAQFLAGTWAIYGVDADGDNSRDVYEPADAVFGMANYLRASGAPHEWRRAVFAYNHADWYVEQVLRQAATYRESAATSASPGGTVISGNGNWLAPLTGFPGERCDARIVPDVVLLVRAFGLHVSDCFGGEPHARDGEHPLGLAIDASPADGDWRRTELLARRFGWRESCAASGCPGAGPFRVILYNGFPDHGDPRHSDVPHIHLSWEHGPAAPFRRAPWVRVVLVASARAGGPHPSPTTAQRAA